LKAGKLEEAHAVFAALAMLDECEDRFFDADLTRVRGELLLAGAAPDVDGAEACFREAVELARRQGTRSLELRATMSLARLWQRSGRSAAARDLVSECLGWFTEGHATADLIAAGKLVGGS
jgi:predicted ATPase